MSGCGAGVGDDVGPGVGVVVGRVAICFELEWSFDFGAGVGGTVVGIGEGTFAGGAKVVDVDGTFVGAVGGQGVGDFDAVSAGAEVDDFVGAFVGVDGGAGVDDFDGLFVGADGSAGVDDFGGTLMGGAEGVVLGVGVGRLTGRTGAAAGGDSAVCGAGCWLGHSAYAP